MAVSYVFYPFKLPSSSRVRPVTLTMTSGAIPSEMPFSKPLFSPAMAMLYLSSSDIISVRYCLICFSSSPLPPRYIHQFREPPTVRAALASEVSQTFEYMEPLRHGTVQMSRRQLAPWQTKPREERNRPPCTKRKNWCFYSCKIKPSCIAEGGILSIFARKTGI